MTSWEPRLYTLHELDSWLDLSGSQDRRKRLPAYGLGRNCNLFEQLSQWSYRAIRQGWPDYEQWHAACLQRALMYNAGFPCPLDHQEVGHVAKSVARYTHARFTPEGFSAWQAAQGRKGGAAKGRALREQLRPKLVRLLSEGRSEAEIARELGQSRQTINNWVRAL